MNVFGVVILFFWALATLSVWCNAVYGVWLTHSGGFSARLQRHVKLGIPVSESLGQQQQRAMVGVYCLRFLLAAGSTSVWVLALGWLL